MSKRLIFPCGAYFPLDERDGWPIDGAHYAKDGAVRIAVCPESRPFHTPEVLRLVEGRSRITYDGPRAPCKYFCPRPKRRRGEMGYDTQGNRDQYITCFARLYTQGNNDEGWYDVTPPPPKKCPHCLEQKSYIAACIRAAKAKSPTPDRMKWRLCPQCGEGAELTTDTGLCASCQDVTSQAASEGAAR